MLRKFINWLKTPLREKIIKIDGAYKLIRREGKGHFAVIKCRHSNRRMTSQPLSDYTEYCCNDCGDYFLERE